jgi:hypothetical protein
MGASASIHPVRIDIPTQKRPRSSAVTFFVVEKGTAKKTGLHNYHDSGVNLKYISVIIKSSK